MIATVHKYRSSLPGRRVELYAEICEVFLGKRQQSKGLELDLTPDQRKRVLQPLALYMMENKIRDVSKLDAQNAIASTLTVVQHRTDPTIFLKNVENDSGLLVENENGRYSFAHLTFQEYLAAEHVKDQPDLLDSLLSHVQESWWHETLLLYSAVADATPIVEACLNVNYMKNVTVLLLAVDCLAEAREVALETQLRLDKVLEDLLNGQDLQQVGVFAKLLLQQRMRSIVRVYDGKYADVSLLTNAEYQLFIDEYGDSEDLPVPAHWSEKHYPIGQGGFPVFGVSTKGVEGFCSWLTNALDDGYRYSIPLKVETKHIPMKIDSGISSAGYWVKNKNNYSIEMAVGQYPIISAELVEPYYVRALGTGIIVESAQSVSKRGEINLNLKLGRYISMAGQLDLMKARRSGIRTGFPDVRYIERAIKLNKTAMGRDLANTDLTLCHAFVKDLKYKYGKDIRYDMALLLVIAGSLLSRLQFEQKSVNKATRNKPAYVNWEKFARSLVLSYTIAFVNLCIQEERKKGDVLPFEGIRLVRLRDGG